MDTGVEGEFSFSDFSPHALTFIPDLNCILASDRNGKTGTIDVVTGRVQQCPGRVNIKAAVLHEGGVFSLGGRSVDG